MSKTQLEQNAAEHRNGLADALGQLVQTLSPKRVGQNAVADAADMGRKTAASVMQSAKANPVGVAMIGVGAALLLSGQRTQRTAASEPAMTEAERIERADHYMRKSEAVSKRPRPGADASRMRKFLDQGLDRLGPEARDKVMALRLKAVEAQETVDRLARNAKRTAVKAHQDNPFFTALAVAGVGALAGALLPNTRKEAELMGAKRDQLMRSAEATLRDEIAKLEARGKEAVRVAVDAGQKEFNAAERTG